MNGSGARKRISVIYLWWIVQLAFRSSSADCFVTSTNAASPSSATHRRHFRQYDWHKQRHLPSSTTNSPSSSSSSPTTAQMVAWIPPRGGSMVPPASAPMPVPVSSQQKTTTEESSRWTKIRRTVFPIHGQHEVTKFLLIGSMKFFIIMALTLTRDTKDTLIVTQCGAEAIAFLKVIGCN